MPICFSIFNLCGYNNKKNIILYREAILNKKDYDSNYIIFFPGDYSNFFNNCIYSCFNLNKSNCSKYCYSYEALFWVLSSKYLYDDIIFIKPNNISNNIVTYINFLKKEDIYGNINENIVSNSIDHLIHLIYSLQTKLLALEQNKYNKNYLSENEIENNENTIENINKNNLFIKKKIILIGFSKGCTVLISLLKEVKETYFFFWKNVKSIFFLDPGFNNNFNFNIDKNALKNIHDYNLKIYLHCTPRQIYDKNKCIHQKLEIFLIMLKKYKIHILAYLHYEYIKVSELFLNLHFEILLDFFDDIKNTLYYVTPLNNEINDILKNKKKKQNFLFESWEKYS